MIAAATSPAVAPPVNEATAATCRVGLAGAVAALVGTFVSGPPSLLLVGALAPQPPWTDGATMAAHYHPLQALPFFAGFFLVGGFVVLMAALHRLAEPRHRARSLAALLFTSAFAALVFFNYTVQTTLVPALVRDYRPDREAVIAVFSMVNPASLAWAVELWAYGILGVATWLVAPVLSRTPLERTTAWLFVANGVTSVISAVATGLVPGWALTTAGIAAFVIWNVLVLAMLGCSVAIFRRRPGP